MPIDGPNLGVNYRSLITMTPSEVDAFIHERHTMTLCTNAPDGTIHAVAMWYGFLEGKIAIETKAVSQKAKNFARNEKATILIHAGDVYDELRGVELVGWGELIEEEERRFELGKSVFDRYYAPYDDSAREKVERLLYKRVVIKFHVTKVVSWDHRKLPRG
jgi:general stress protein 26